MLKHTDAVVLEGLNDPFRPPDMPRMVQCLHCGDIYVSDGMRYESRFGNPEEYWYCQNRGCDGAGYGFDIFSVK